MRYCFLSIPTNKLMIKFKDKMIEPTKIQDINRYVAQLRKCKNMLDEPHCNKKRIEECIETYKHLISEIQKQMCEKRIQAIKRVTPHIQKHKQIQNSFNQSQK